MSFSETFTIVNSSNYTLYLDAAGSQNLGDGAWPAQVPARTTSAPFKQTGFFSVNPTAVYALGGTNPPVSAYLHFYCAGVDPFLRVNMTMQFSPGPVFAGSSISENNTDNGHSWTTATANGSQSIIEIGTTGNGASLGSATFTIAAG